MAKGIDWNLILIVGAGWYAYRSGLLTKLLADLRGQLPDGDGNGDGGDGGGGVNVSEDQAALVISSHRPDLCANITAWSNGQYNCTTQANTITLVKHWWYTMNPPERSQYSSLVAYAQAMGWT